MPEYPMLNEGEEIVYHVSNKTIMTAVEAAEDFARNYFRHFPKGYREVAVWIGLMFFLAKGTVWYRCDEMVDGWNIVRTEEAI